jgi:hypothetical protein
LHFFLGFKSQKMNTLMSKPFRIKWKIDYLLFFILLKKISN